MAGLLGSFFNFVDPILDTIDPIHNPVQEWTTGSSTTKGQSPYFETIAPMVLDLFLPGVGSAVGAADKASTGNYAGAALSALSAYGALGSAGSAGTGAGTELAATEGLSSTAGTAAGTTAENAVAAYPVGTMTNSGGEILDAGSTTLTSGAADAGGASSVSRTASPTTPRQVSPVTAGSTTKTERPFHRLVSITLAANS